MPEYAVPTPKRRRGRPRGGESGARERIIAAAIEEFGELGYDGATMRGIAARAGVDAALLHHYFGTKADLFAETIGAPMRPDVDIPTLLAGPARRAGRAPRAVRARGVGAPRDAQARRDAAARRHRQPARDAAAVGVPAAGAVLADRRALDTPDAALRASLVASQMAGLLIARYLLQLPALAEASVDELVARVGPTVQRYLSE